MTTTLAVVGHPIAHSKSPALHRAAYEVLGLDWKYVAVDVQPEQFDQFLESTDETLRGLSVTMPHKLSALNAADSIDLLAEQTQSVNTLLFDYSTGVRTSSGFNTDVWGIVHAFRDTGVASAHHVAVIGGGATASSAVAASAELGAEHISVIVRSPEKAFHLEQVGARCGVKVSIHQLDDVNSLAPVDVAISTLPGDAEHSLAGIPRTERATLLDVAYSPWPSIRATEWSLAGGEVVSGLRMLAHQALIQVRIFVNGDPLQPLTNETAVQEAMFAAVSLN